MTIFDQCYLEVFDIDRNPTEGYLDRQDWFCRVLFSRFRFRLQIFQEEKISIRKLKSPNGRVGEMQTEIPKKKKARQIKLFGFFVLKYQFHLLLFVGLRRYSFVLEKCLQPKKTEIGRKG